MLVRGVGDLQVLEDYSAVTVHLHQVLVVIFNCAQERQFVVGTLAYCMERNGKSVSVCLVASCWLEHACKMSVTTQWHPSTTEFWQLLFLFLFRHEKYLQKVTNNTTSPYKSMTVDANLILDSLKLTKMAGICFN